MLEQILYLAEKRTLPQTMLFAGPKGAGKYAAALKVAETLLGLHGQQHPDLHLYVPDSAGGMHSIEAMRKLTQEIHMAPYQAAVKVFILEDADQMLPTSSNALLKTLEEPSLHSYILLLSTRPDAILPTILSRARKFTFFKTDKKRIERTEERDLLIKLLSQKVPYQEQMTMLATLSEEENPDRILEEALYWNRDRHLLNNGADPAHLYFSAYRPELEACTLPLPSQETYFDLIEKARFSHHQHINLRHTLPLLLP